MGRILAPAAMSGGDHGVVRKVEWDGERCHARHRRKLAGAATGHAGDEIGRRNPNAAAW